ncbi:flagellar type III secretion system pore protein FliP [Thiorhodospira sibirica]|uniref:flagellar type III secretion system pore protein FliP n=1 Tax=Thiorhodospira sibirica TaxID=154347 RepID=UPI00022C525C|nr:flagellar type III secretion system pore protein FliP [Thiorhodospira sibirica]
MKCKGFLWLAVMLLALIPLSAAQAQATFPILTVTPGAGGSEEYSVTLQVLILMTMLSLIPAALIMMTSFTRIIIVLGILRQGLGTAQTPNNQILVGLAFFLTLFIMLPIFERINEEAVQPYMQEEITLQEGLSRASVPMHRFMIEQTRETDLAMFARIGGYETFESPDDVPFSLLVPAFITSELKTAFQIGFLILIPFLIIDLVVASVLMSMGMMMLPPVMIALPFKLMLFVMIDGWPLLMGTLASSFVVV